MVKHFLKFMKIVCIIVLILFGILCYFMYRIPSGGELLYSTSSPAGKYIIDVYYHPHSLSPDGVRCTVRATDGIVSRNIYWCFPKENVKIEWISETEVIIDDVTLDVKKDRYDCRRE